MKKLLFYTLVLVLVISISTGCGKEEKKQPIDNKDNVSEQEKNLDDTTAKEQDGIVFKNIRIEKQGATSIVRGNVENKSGDTKDFKVQLVMSNSETKRVYGRVETDIENLADSEKRDFQISIVGDYGLVDAFEVIIIK